MAGLAPFPPRGDLPQILGASATSRRQRAPTAHVFDVGQEFHGRDASTLLAKSNSDLLFAANSKALDDSAMTKALSSVRDTRRIRLANLLDEYGQQELGELTGIAPAYLWQMAKGEGTQKRGISDDNAAKIEAGVKKPPGWLSGEIHTQGQSQSVRPDPQMLAESIAALRMVAKRRGWDYDPEVHADATCDAYEMRTLLPSAPSTAQVIDFGQKVAERLAREFGDGSEGGSGTRASVGRNDRGKHSTNHRTGKARSKGSS